jgi:uncharacterized protein HemX
MADDLQMLTERSARELAGLKRLVVALLIVSGVTAVAALWQLQELGRVRTQVGRLQSALSAEADRRLQALTPQLETRAQRIEASADRADKAVQGLDAKIDAAGDRIASRAVERMEAELPGFMDRYFESRLRP